jgi:DNA (cytosine-5)-methyltransferase 1
MAKDGLVYGSVCSGISAESVAWKSLGWKAAWFSQFDPEHNYESGPDFPSAVLAHHCPHIPNLGDANEIHQKPEFNKSKIDILVGGTPCQSFAPNGLRQGFNDPRGRLTLRFAEIAKLRRPRWIIWENVPDILSSNEGKDFRAFLRKLRDAGYGYSWRFLDAADFGLPQSRKRIFLVGHIGGEWKRAAAVLAQRGGMRGALEAERDAAAEGGAAGAAGASAIFAVQGNVIGRNPGAGPQGRGIRQGLMYCLTASDHHAVIVDGVARYVTPVEAERL